MKQTELVVLDIQKYALHDGPGVRTTVFLKGCPLTCIWCHNPESQNVQPQLGCIYKDCVGCGNCETVCTEQVHSFAKGKHLVDFQACVGCGRCVEECYSRALRMYGTYMDSESVVKKALEDFDYYQNTGGGITISGGEPMMQYSQLLELLKVAKKAGLHVCLDTCGQAPTKHYIEISKYVDLFLFDYKLTDADQHQKYTGVSNQLILENIHALGEEKAAMFLRCPIIPDINDNEEHLQAIAKLSNTYESIREVNLMFYHDMAKGKSAQVGIEYELEGLKTVEETYKYKIEEQLKSYGCDKLHKS